MSRSPSTPGVCAKQIAYLAGPMRGYAEYNFPAFNAAAAKLRAHGLDVWSPAEHDVNEDGFDPAKDTHQPMRHYMRRDLPAVLNADMVCVLPGWEKSQGACLEVHVAQTCGIPVYVAETMEPVVSSETATPEMLNQVEQNKPSSNPSARGDIEIDRILGAALADALQEDFEGIREIAQNVKIEMKDGEPHVTHEAMRDAYVKLCGLKGVMPNGA